MKKIVVLGSVLLITLSAQAGLYRWVDDAGNVHFSDKVPAAASTKTHSELNKTGDVTKTVDPASIQNEIDLEKIAANEKAKKEEIQRIKQEALDIVYKRDDYLLATYENEDELKHSFESKIKMLKGNSRILEAQNNVLTKKIANLEKKVTKVTHKDTLLTLAGKIVNINKTIVQYKQALEENETQIAKLNSDYKTDLERFKELTK
ncbi:DUF4124 domain-containing protein [Cocleimonas sp. KMM 6892]|uniref:DUF4124 domain-containing protein n=1 Tax=unclassified Cocleimonas TaxID=2639732 RepID=UPI002DB9706B|nr:MULTISPECIES: DUF4124 domain-containing protein [unclassified Cocleimonas]MEB8432217.1 DUF4124 domain-containing protein [Cocleimonas sp. KMM 6892]MEC4714697.1 DUF4124 domain-containing protein [Cocleimonas sp. KMM 6895]MEC4744489.1 DUF4124 domain-containing protein [Cocleimonas sp. KMM 6896]